VAPTGPQVIEKKTTILEPSPLRRLDLGRNSFQHAARLEGANQISPGREIGAGNSGSAVSLLFAAGRRPSADSIRALARDGGGFSVSFDPSADAAAPGAPADAAEPVWLELLASGMTFDLLGLAPGPPPDPPPCVHGYALAANADPIGLEAVPLRPGPHIEAGSRMLPVVRALAALAATLSAIDGVQAVAWHPARSWCGAEYFREGVRRWVEGGVFPGLGLTSLALTAEGGMQSEGLALFTGQELRLEPELMTDRAAGAKIGVRLIDHLVAVGQIDRPQRIDGPDGQALRLEPSANGRFVRVWRG
jgi:hypothetical protein